MPATRLICLPLLAVLFVSSACNRDPNVKKQKYFESGNRYFEKGEYPEAAIQFSNAVQVDAGYAAAHFRLGETYLKMQSFPNAYRELQRTVEIDPANSKALFDLGLLYISGKAYDQVEPIAEKMLKQDPKDAEAHLLLSQLNRAQGNSERALEEVQKAIQLAPTRPELYVQLATLQADVGKNDDAEASLKKALASNPKFIPAVHSLGFLYAGTGQWADAEKQLRYAIDLQPKEVEPRVDLARLYYSEQRKTDSEQVMIQAKKDLSRDGDHYRVLAEYYRNVRETDKALAEFASISKEHPKDLKTKEEYIRLLLSSGKADEAAKLNDAVLQENPQDTGEQIIRGTILNSQGKFDDARRILEGAVKGAPENADGHYQLGFACSKTGELGRAEQEWREAVQIEPRLNEAQLALAQIAITKKDRDLLLRSAEQAITNVPSDPRGYILLAAAETQPKIVEADLKKAIEVAPQSALPYAAMGDYLARHAKIQEGRLYYERALDRDPNYFPPLAGIAATLMNEKQDKKALERVQAQIMKAPRNDAMYSLLGGLQVGDKDLAGAETSLRKAVELNENNLDAFILLSKVEMARGEADSAVGTAYKSVEDNPRNVGAYFFAGTLEELQNRTQKAEDWYKKALEVEPNYAPAANNLAYLMLQNGENTDVALSLAQIARQRMPDSPNAADTLAWAYYEKGIYSLASDLLQEALEKSPDNATYHYHLGMVYEKQNNAAAAKKHFLRALQINPKSPQAPEIRRTLNQTS